MATIFDRIRKREEIIGASSSHMMRLNPEWSCEVRASTEVRWHKDHGEVYELEVTLRSECGGFLNYFYEIGRVRMRRDPFLKELVDPDGAELLLKSFGGYIRLLTDFEPPEKVVRVLEGMGYKMTPSGMRIGSYCYLPGGRLEVSPDPALFPLWTPSHLEAKELRCHQGSTEARRLLDEQRRSLDVYDTILRTCYT